MESFGFEEYHTEEHTHAHALCYNTHLEKSKGI
jgi:hypothetical protein